MSGQQQGLSAEEQKRSDAEALVSAYYLNECTLADLSDKQQGGFLDMADVIAARLAAVTAERDALTAKVAAVREVLRRLANDDVDYDTSYGASGLMRLETDLRAALDSPGDAQEQPCRGARQTASYSQVVRYEGDA